MYENDIYAEYCFAIKWVFINVKSVHKNQTSSSFKMLNAGWIFMIENESKYLSSMITIVVYLYIR